MVNKALLQQSVASATLLADKQVTNVSDLRNASDFITNGVTRIRKLFTITIEHYFCPIFHNNSKYFLYPAETSLSSIKRL